MARKRQSSDDGPSTGWLATYGDLVTLLLCFFVMLYASMGNGTADPSVLNQIAASLSASAIPTASVIDITSIMGINNLIGTGITQMPPMSEGSQESKGKYEATLTGMIEMADNFKTYFAAQELYEQIEVEAGVNFVRLNFKDMLFDKGRAELKPEAIDILDLVAAEIINYSDSSEIYIEGHTDSDPINTIRFKDNWALSNERAAEVGRYFITQKGIDPVRIVTIGYGEFRPVAPNDTEVNKTQNRRVEIKIMQSAAQ